MSEHAISLDEPGLVLGSRPPYRATIYSEPNVSILRTFARDGKACVPTFTYLLARSRRSHMSDEMIALIVTVAIIGLLFAWPPFLNFICPPCGRFLKQRRVEKQTTEKQVTGRGSAATATRH